ncbi:hypothetical protein PspR32_19670 [Pseudomonas sp. R32]|nr:hypothetical protein PspR32_19670 [Pseudomonas sp. R32]
MGVTVKIQHRPNFQPLSMLMVVADVVAGQLTTLVDQRKALLEAKARLGSMDAGTSNHVLRVFSETTELMPI